MTNAGKPSVLVIRIRHFDADLRKVVGMGP